MKTIDGRIKEQIDEAEEFALSNIKKAAWIETGKIQRVEN